MKKPINARLAALAAAVAVLFAWSASAGAQSVAFTFAQAWGQAGHFIGNYTMTHPDLHSAKVSRRSTSRRSSIAPDGILLSPDTAFRSP